MGSILEAAAPKSDQINYDDFIGGKSKIIKITRVDLKESGEQRVWVYYEGDNGKPYKPCKTMARVMSEIFGDHETDPVGHSMKLIGDPSVKFGPNAVGGIRIHSMTSITETTNVLVTIAQGRKGRYRVEPLNIEPRQPETPQISAEDALSDAKLAAGKGKEAFTAWWNKNKHLRELVRPNMSELSDIAATADSDAPTDEVPFE